MSLVINEYFKSQYLTSGNTYDNFVFHNCPIELLDYAEQELSKRGDDCIPCVIRFTRDDEKKLSRTLDNCADDYERTILARTYYLTRFMKELSSSAGKEYREFSLENLTNGIEFLTSGNVELAKKYYIRSPFMDQIDSFIRRLGKIELDILLDGVNGVYLQKAINNSLSSRTPYSIKVFNTGDRFVTSYAENGQLVEPTHDYMLRDINGFIDFIQDNPSI
jgi:transposase